MTVFSGVCEWERDEGRRILPCSYSKPLFLRKCHDIDRTVKSLNFFLMVSLSPMINGNVKTSRKL